MNMTRVDIDLFEFAKCGHFDRIKLGQTRAWVLENFPLPDGFKEEDDWREGAFEIFSYGDFELHFTDDILTLIFADFFGVIDAGDSLLFSKPWIFEKNTSELSLSFVEQEFTKKGVAFTSTKNNKLFSATLKTREGAEIHFESDESLDPADYFFSAFWISNPATT